MDRKNPSVPHSTLISTTNLDASLGRLLSEPSYAHRFLTGIADVLDNNPFLVANEDLLAEARRLAKAYTLGALPRIVAVDAEQTALGELPAACPGEMAGDYALRLRAAAEDLR